MNNQELANMCSQIVRVEMLNVQLQGLSEAVAAQGVDTSQAQHLHHCVRETLSGLQEEIRIKMNENTQATLLNSFEIFGVPGDVNNVVDIAKILTEVLQVSIAASAIRGFETLQTFRLQHAEPMSVPDVAWVVHMNKRQDRDRILSLAGSGPLALPGEEAPLYFAEHLTFMNKQLLRRAMQEGQALNFDAVWVDGGKIFVRKGVGSVAYQIHSVEDIEKMAFYM